jgi:hypothetical protein
MPDRYDPRRERGDLEAGPEWDREGEWEEGGQSEEEVYGPYGRLDRSRQGISVRSRNAGRRMSLFGTGSQGFGMPPYRRKPSYTSGMGSYSGQGSYAGRGPRGWHRSDERILEDVNERLTDHPDIDATDIEVAVKNGEVTLTGLVESRPVKRMAEDVAESASGVREIHNQLRIREYREERPQREQPDQATGTTGRKEPDGTTNR